jgi:phosphoribosyl-ATP pyrophosphohydrolase / phosphoribosyl-AMP cyclohydrolase / histidinol dehydrogenase
MVGFCHLNRMSCFGPSKGLSQLEKTLQARRETAPKGSYVARLFSDPSLLRSKIMEEAEEVCDATEPKDIAWEVADLLFFAMTKCVANGVSFADVEAQLDKRAKKISRRKGDAKPKWTEQKPNDSPSEAKALEKADAPVTKTLPPTSEETRIKMRVYNSKSISASERTALLSRPIQKTTQIMPIVQTIIDAVRSRGDTAILEYTAKFEKATTLKSPVLKAPFPKELMDLPDATKKAIDTAFENIRMFHSAQLDSPKHVETMPGITCSRFARPIERVGLYVPGGTAVLPSTAMMLGVPALVAGCKTIQFATPPRSDGSVVPEIVYIAHKVGATGIVLAGGAQAVAALAYGTESVAKCDKIFGPGNQFVTAAKLAVQSDSAALVGVDLPAGPSEVLVLHLQNGADIRWSPILLRIQNL